MSGVNLISVDDLFQSRRFMEKTHFYISQSTLTTLLITVNVTNVLVLIIISNQGPTGISGSGADISLVEQ